MHHNIPTEGNRATWGPFACSPCRPGQHVRTTDHGRPDCGAILVSGGRTEILFLPTVVPCPWTHSLLVASPVISRKSAGRRLEPAGRPRGHDCQSAHLFLCLKTWKDMGYSTCRFGFSGTKLWYTRAYSIFLSLTFKLYNRLLLRTLNMVQRLSVRKLTQNKSVWVPLSLAGRTSYDYAISIRVLSYVPMFVKKTFSLTVSCCPRISADRNGRNVTYER
jgi:hypothetical protein